MGKFEFSAIQGVGSRWLTPDAKAAILREWQHTRATVAEGLGAPDAEILPLCNKLNEIPGVCTLQSCAGHKRARYRESAHLWLWLSEDLSREFDAQAFAFASEEGIEAVKRRYTPWGQEVTMITFAGKERSGLERSADTIASFFDRLAS